MRWRLPIAAILLFLPAPIAIVALSSVTSRGYLTFPPSSFSLRWYTEFLSSAEWLRALAISVLLAFSAACGSVLIAFLASQVIARKRFAGRSLLETLMLMPIIFPHAALGVAMLGIVSSLHWNGTFVGLVLAHVVLTVPYAYRPLIASIRALDPVMEEAAMSLGARPGTILKRVTLPLLRPGLITALVFAFVISFDEVTVTMFLVGPDMSTIPVRIFAQIQESASPVIAAISTVLIGFTVLIVALTQWLLGLEAFLDIGAGRSSRPAA